MNNKLVKKIRKHVKETMAQDAQWAVYDTKIVKRPVLLDAVGKTGEAVTHVKSLVKGCGKQRLKTLKKMYKEAYRKNGGLV